MAWKIEKHYFDLQTADGESFIGYRGLWGSSWLKFSYGAWLWKAPGRPASFKQSLRAGELALTLGAETGPNQAIWTHKPLRLRGSWAGRLGKGPKLHLENKDGHIDWQVLGAALPARVSFEGRTLNGIGYWEKVELNIAPWRLPFPELRWGRFLADKACFHLVWVAWLGGETEEKRLWSYEAEMTGLTFEAETALACDSGRLEFDSLEILRQGPLLKTLGGPLAIGARLLPGGLGRAHESKWSSRAHWRAADGSVIHGWAIHEKVTWR